MSGVFKGIGGVAGGLLKGTGLFGTEQGTVQTQANNTPWAGVQPHLLNLFGRAQSLSNRDPYSYEPSAATSQAEQMAIGRATDPNSAIGMTPQVLADTVSGKYLTPDSNPYLKASVQDALGMAGSAFAGQYGGAAGQNLSNSGYQEALARGLGATATNAYANAYGQERQNQMSAMQMAPSLGMADTSALAAVGAQQDSRDLARYNAPWSNINQYQAALSPGMAFGQQTSQQPYFQNNTANTLGMAALALPFLGFSDARLKDNIERVGTHSTGIGLYKYTYKGDNKPQIGVLAQELEQVMPEAVHEVDGYKAVDYRMI